MVYRSSVNHVHLVRHVEWCCGNCVCVLLLCFEGQQSRPAWVRIPCVGLVERLLVLAKPLPYRKPAGFTLKLLRRFGHQRFGTTGACRWHLGSKMVPEL